MPVHGNYKRAAVCLSVILAQVLGVDQARASGLDSLRFKNGMVHGLTDIDQNMLRGCSGDLYGIEDESGRIIIPPKYSDIEYCGHGIFLATDVQKANKYFFGDKRHFFNRDGVELSFVLPENAFLLNIFSFGEKADKETDLVLTKFAADTILLFGYRVAPQPQTLNTCMQGLCDLNGKVLMQPISGNILFLEPGLAFVDAPGNKRSIVDLKTWSAKPTSLERNPGSVPRSRIHWPSNYQVPMPFPKDRIRKVVSTDTGTFDSDYWRERRDHPIRCLEMFNRFLHQYDLIGMQKDRVAVLLGESDRTNTWATNPEGFTYRFPSYSCTGEFSGLKIYVKNDHVASWSFIASNSFGNTGNESEPITTNVVLKRADTGRIIGARIGQAKYEFPETEPKSAAELQSPKDKENVTTAERLTRLKLLLAQLRTLRKQADAAWDKEIASDTKLRQTNDGFWQKHEQDKTIDARCNEVEFRIKELELKEKQSKTKR